MAVISAFLGVICVILVGHLYMLHKLTKAVGKVVVRGDDAYDVPSYPTKYVESNPPVSLA
jgi:hypothetical protein